MTRTTKISACVINTGISQENSSVYQESSSSDQETQMQDPSLQPSISPTQLVPAMFMPYIEHPKMDLTMMACIMGS